MRIDANIIVLFDEPFRCVSFEDRCKASVIMSVLKSGAKDEEVFIHKSRWTESRTWTSVRWQTVLGDILSQAKTPMKPAISPELSKEEYDQRIKQYLKDPL